MSATFDEVITPDAARAIVATAPGQRLVDDSAWWMTAPGG